MENFLENRIFFHYVNTALMTDLTLVAMGYEICDSQKDGIGPFEKNHFMIHYVISGSGYLELGGKTYCVAKDDIFYIPAEEVFYYQQSISDPWEYIWIEFTGLKALNICKTALFSVQNPIYHCSDPCVKEILSKIFEFPNNEISLELYCISVVYNFFSKIINLRNSASQQKTSSTERIVQKVIDYIENNYSDPNLSLSSLADQMHLSASYLSRIFKEITGVPFSKYVISLRLQKASALIELGNSSIKSIAHTVGYSDPHFFSKQFKKHKGINPSQYKEVGIYNEEK